MNVQSNPSPPTAGAPRNTDDRSPDRLPDYLPARMVNEFVYCPRLFFYEWVDGLFRESVDTVEGTFQHRRVDAERARKTNKNLPKPDELAEEKLHSRSVTLASDKHRVIAKIDLVEASGGVVTPVDYKHGYPRETDEGIEPWPSDRIQLGVHGLLLRENGYTCEEGIIFYAKTRQRVRIPVDAALLAETEQRIAEAWAVAQGGEIPPPLVDSPKCPGCSLVGICLPDETNSLRLVTPQRDGAIQLNLFSANGNPGPAEPVTAELRRLVTPRDELRPLYLNAQGVRVGKSGEVLQVRAKDGLKQDVRIGEICQINLMGNVQISTQAVQGLCTAEIPICYFSQGGWFYGITTGLNKKNIFLRRIQFRLADEGWFALALSRDLVAGKIRNQRTLLQRNHLQPDPQTLRALKHMAERARNAADLEELLGVEGNAARLYFQDFSGMIKLSEDGAPECQFRFDFSGRNRRPPRDAVNALLSLAYSLLAKDFTIACYAVGFDPFLGYHQPRFGRPALALDLMEPFRPLIADSAVLAAINTRMVTPRDFVQSGPAVALTPSGRKAFFHAYELRMDALVTHPLFEYRVSYRRLWKSRRGCWRGCWRARSVSILFSLRAESLRAVGRSKMPATRSKLPGPCNHTQLPATLHFKEGLAPGEQPNARIAGLSSLKTRDIYCS